MASTGDGLSSFLTTRRADLRRIAARTCGEYTIDDVCSEAWLIGHEIERKRGLPVDFGNSDDEEVVLSWLYCKLVRHADKSVRFAVKLDKDWDREGYESVAESLARLLTAPEHFDPLVKLQADESRFDPLALTQHSYSQASAYVILLHRFDWDLDDLSDHLRLKPATVRGRVIASAVRMRVQPSLFDGIEAVELTFVATIARRLFSGPAIESGQIQLTWDFLGCREPVMPCPWALFGRQPRAR